MISPSFPDFVDPKTGSALLIKGSELFSSESKTSYKLVGGIARFVEGENYASNFGRQWLRFSKTQLDSHNKFTISEDRLKRCLGGDLAILNGKVVLEAGSGAGRFTEILLKHGAIVDTFDYSSAIEANKDNHGAVPNLRYAQADINHMPYPLNSYDFVICLGVVQHTKSPLNTIRELFKRLKPHSGLLVIDHYKLKIKSLPPPIGGAGNLYRLIILLMPKRWAMPISDALVRFFFPLHWFLRNSYIAQQILLRVSPVRFYYPWLGLRGKQEYFEWALLDTHDGSTDRYKHFATESKIKSFLIDIGGAEIKVWSGGNGVEAVCKKYI
jgi:2-polyprenyl-3-methyl-5-hydroxy-6-metoxy-1,4-benzoquinol methylase